jgi:hypothetical protein
VPWNEFDAAVVAVVSWVEQDCYFVDVPRWRSIEFVVERKSNISSSGVELDK